MSPPPTAPLRKLSKLVVVGTAPCLRNTVPAVCAILKDAYILAVFAARRVDADVETFTTVEVLFAFATNNDDVVAAPMVPVCAFVKEIPTVDVAGRLTGNVEVLTPPVKGAPMLPVIPRMWTVELVATLMLDDDPIWTVPEELAKVIDDVVVTTAAPSVEVDKKLTGKVEVLTPPVKGAEIVPVMSLISPIVIVGASWSVIEDVGESIVLPSWSTAKRAMLEVLVFRVRLDAYFPYISTGW